MKKVALVIFIFTTIGTFAQDLTIDDLDKKIKPLTEDIQRLYIENRSLNSQLETLKADLLYAHKSIDSLRKKTEDNKNVISQTASQLGIEIKETSNKNENKIIEVADSLSKNSLYGIIGVLSTILLSGLLFWVLKKKQKNDKTDVEGKLSQTKKSIDEEQIQINTKLAELYNGQMEFLKVERKTNPGKGEVDHSLPLKVANEIVKMQMNLIHMDNKVKGHKQLSIAVTNVFDNFKANGYEIIDHLNRPYNDGMNMDASKEPDPLLKDGEQIIRRIIKPEVHFNNKMIQKAQVIVAYGE